MKITIDAPDYEAEDYHGVAMLLYAIANHFENNPEDEDVMLTSCSLNIFPKIDDWELKTHVLLDVEDY